MRKKMKSWSAIGLAAMMAVSMIGCGKETKGGAANNNWKDERGEKIFDKYIEDEEVVDLKGYSFKIVDFDTNVWKPETVEDARSQLSVDIIEDVEKTFNCKIEVEYVAPNSIFENAQPSIMSGDKYADMVGTTLWAYGPLLSGGLVADLSDIETLDLSQDYFTSEVSDMLTFGDSTYAFAADFAAHLYSEVGVYYNSRVWKELGLPDPYQLVRDGQWTWDKLLEYANKALADRDGDGVVSSDTDRWGVCGGNGDMLCAMYASMGGDIYDIDENGKVYLDCLDADSLEKIRFLYQFCQENNVLYKRGNDGYMDLFTQGNSLFMVRILTTRDELKNMEDDFGILPLPKWNAEQEDYQTYVTHNAKIYCIPKTNENTYEAGIIISALARRYQSYMDVAEDEMIDIMLRFDEDEEMLTDYIWNKTRFEISDVLEKVNETLNNPRYAIYHACLDNKFSDIGSEIASYDKAIEKILEELLENYGK